MGRKLTDAAAYRVRQFLTALTARPLCQAERALVEQYLSPVQQALFQRMPRTDQKHAVSVARMLLDEGWSDTDLIQAALLHDVGKADGGLHLGYRVAIVLLRAFWPAGLKRIAATDTGWRRPFHIHQLHPEIGAQLAAEAGSSSRVVELILQHQSPVGEGEIEKALVALRLADESH